MLCVTSLADLTPTAQKVVPSVLCLSWMVSRREWKSSTAGKTVIPKIYKRRTRGNSHQHKVNKHPDYWLHAAHRTLGISANFFPLVRWATDSMLYFASSVLMNNALINTAANILLEPRSQMSSGPPIVLTLGQRQTRKINTRLHCRMGNSSMQNYVQY